MGGWSWILRLANVIKNEVLLYNIGNYIPYPVKIIIEKKKIKKKFLSIKKKISLEHLKSKG